MLKPWLFALALWAAPIHATLACSCFAPNPLLSPEQELQQQLDLNLAVVLAEVIGYERKTWELAFTAEHLGGRMSPWHGEDFVSLRVLRSWSAGIKPGQQLFVHQRDGASCGYEAWSQSRQHLLFLRRQTWWSAHLCGLSAPASEAKGTIQLLDQGLSKVKPSASASSAAN